MILQILIWWKSTINEVYPWSPAVKEHDRANIHLYRLIGYIKFLFKFFTLIPMILLILILMYCYFQSKIRINLLYT